MSLKSHTKFTLPIALLLLFIAFSPPPTLPTHAQDNDPNACFEHVQIATELASASCTGLLINETCYGYGDLSPTLAPTATNATFQSSGDRVSIGDVQSLSGSSTDWSVALIALQNPAPDAPIPTTLALLGDAQITDANITEERGLTCPLLNNTTNTVNVRAGTSTDREVVGSIFPSENVTAMARNDLGDWVQIPLDDGVGWVYAPLFETNCDVFALPVVDETTVVEPPPAPFQAITLTSTQDETCPQSPNGLLVYTVFGYPYELVVNSVNLHVNGAAFLTATSENSLSIRALEGEITASTSDHRQLLLPRMTTTFSDGEFSDVERSTADDLVPMMVDVLLNGQTLDIVISAINASVDAENADRLLEPIECEVGSSETVILDYSRPVDFNTTITAASDGGISIVLVNQGTAWVQCNRVGEFGGLITVSYGDGGQETIGVQVTATPAIEEDAEAEED